MPSETDCLNDALGQIGSARITAIDDGSVNANHCQTFYPSLRDASLRSHRWNFADRRAELAQDAATPAFEFSFQYTLPADHLATREYNGTSLDTSNLTSLEAILALRSRYKIEGRKLLTNDGEVKIVYTARITDPNVWDGMFYQYMATALASKLASAITKDEKKSKSKLEEAMLLWDQATAVDGQEGTVTPIRSTELLWGR